jgi:hypothetical protein
MSLNRTFCFIKIWGVVCSSNIGLGLSNGKYWMRVDSDDFISSYAVYNMSEILGNNPEYDFVYCDHIRANVHRVKKELVR